MELAKELFDWIVAQTGLQAGVEIHCGYMPVLTEGPAAVLLERPGDPMQPRLRHNLGEYGFQVLTLGPTGSDYWQAHGLATQIFEACNDVPGAILGDGTYAPEWYAEQIRARTNPAMLGGDERYRWEISFDLQVSARTAQLMVL